MKMSPLVGAVLALVICSQAGHAQAVAGSYNNSGLQLGAYLNGTGATYEDVDETDSGSGFTVRVGYGFGNRVSLFLAGTGSSMESGDYTMGHADLGARYLFSEARLRPYMQAAISGRAAIVDLGSETLEMRGVGPSLGAGLEFGITRSAAIDLGLNYTLGRYTEARFRGNSWEDLGNDGMKSSSARVDLGLIWRP